MGEWKEAERGERWALTSLAAVGTVVVEGEGLDRLRTETCFARSRDRDLPATRPIARAPPPPLCVCAFRRSLQEDVEIMIPM